MEDENHLYHPEHDQCGEHRTAAVADKRESNAGQGNKLCLTAYGQESLENIADRRPIGKELEETVRIPR